MTNAKLALRRKNKAERLERVGKLARGKFVSPEKVPQVLKRIIEPGDRLCLEGDNQKQADFLSRTLAQCDPGMVNGLHMLISSVSRPEHLDLFEQKLASKLDSAYSGPPSCAKYRWPKTLRRWLSVTTTTSPRRAR